MVTRKHFEIIADELKATLKGIGEDSGIFASGEISGFLQAVSAVCDGLKAINPRFDRHKFFERVKGR